MSARVIKLDEPEHNSVAELSKSMGNCAGFLQCFFLGSSHSKISIFEGQQNIANITIGG